MFKRTSVVLAIVAMALVLPLSVSAKSPRIPTDNQPFDFPAAWCNAAGVDWHADFVVDRESGKVGTSLDGSLQVSINGSLRWTVTNPNNGRSLTATISGPATQTFAADGNSVSVEFRGRTGLIAPNLTDHGLPSNGVIVSGAFRLDAPLDSPEIFAVSRVPHVELDVCAALR